MFRPGQTQHCMQMTLRFNTEKCKVQTVQYQGDTTQGNTTQRNFHIASLEMSYLHVKQKKILVQ
jgi:hypothetical protein